MKVFDNVTKIARDDMEQTIKRGSKVSIAAACFFNTESILKQYGYSVSRSDGLSDRERQELLEEIIDLGILPVKKLLTFSIFLFNLIQERYMPR